MKIRILYIILGLFLLTTSCSKEVFKKSNQVIDTVQQDNEYQYVFTEATKQYLTGNIKTALKLYLKCIDDFPSKAAPYYQLSLIYTRINDFDKAEEYARKASYLKPDNEWYRYQLTNLYRAQEKYDSMLVQYKKLIELDPFNPEILYGLANTYQKLEKYEEAIQVLNKIEEKFGVSLRISLAKHALYEKQGELVKAEKELLELIELNASNENLYGVLAEFYAEHKQIEKAKEFYNKLFEINKNSKEGYLSAGDFYREQGEYEESITYYEKVLADTLYNPNIKIQSLADIINDKKFLKAKPDQIKTLILKNNEKKDPRYLNLLVDYFINLNKYDSAKVYINNLINRQPKNYILYEQLMYINNMNNNRKELLEIGNKTIDKFPERPLAYLFVSMAYLQEEKYAKALEKLEKGQDLAQGTTLESQFNIFLGDAYYYTGNFEKSKDIFETILESDPDNIPVKNNYSYYLSIEGQNLKKAQKMSKSTILAEPDNPTYLDTYAWILFKRKKYEEALQYIEKAYQNGGNDSEEILEHYIEILKKLNFEKKSEQINNELLKLKDED